VWIAWAFVIVGLILPTALLVETYPVPAPATSCLSDCPHNAFMLVSAEPAFVEDIVRPLRELLVAALFAAATVRLGTRVTPCVVVYRLDDRLFFANQSYVKAPVRGAKSDTHDLVLDAEGMTHIDVAGLEALRELSPPPGARRDHAARGLHEVARPATR
jgi:hypothetical protein